MPKAVPETEVETQCTVHTTQNAPKHMILKGNSFPLLRRSCRYYLVVYDNLYIINKHFSNEIEILYSEIPMNTNTTKCSNIYVYNQYMNVKITQK